MTFDFHLPVRLFTGKDCVSENRSELILGKHPLIVTGRSGAKKSGALDEVLNIIKSAGGEALIFDKTEENPSYKTVLEGAKAAASGHCDYVIGIGGGSALDAAKAVAALAVNTDICEEDFFFSQSKLSPPLPMAAIPTTAGTGSEMNQYSVLTIDNGRRKKTFKSPSSYPSVSFCDPKYTETLPVFQTISCALDAFAHSIESYVSVRSNPATELFSLRAAKLIWETLFAPDKNYESLFKGDINEEGFFKEDDRECLLYAASMAGAAIGHTGTGFPHPMGYSLTLHKSIPHGLACALFDGYFLECNEKIPDVRDKINQLYKFIGTSGEILKEKLECLVQVTIRKYCPSSVAALSDTEIKDFISLLDTSGSYSNSPYIPTSDEAESFYRKSLS